MANPVSRRLFIARLLVVLGFVAGLGSLWSTFTHIGDPLYLVTPEFGRGSAHAWYHALREAFGDIATIIVVLLIFFGADRYRKPSSWLICLILLLGYYLPFWVGMPFMEELSAPSLQAELNHISQAVLSLAGLFYGRAEFLKKNS